MESRQHVNLGILTYDNLAHSQFGVHCDSNMQEFYKSHHE
jgi:hypothetical protein